MGIMQVVFTLSIPICRKSDWSSFRICSPSKPLRWTISNRLQSDGVKTEQNYNCITEESVSETFSYQPQMQPISWSIFYRSPHFQPKVHVRWSRSKLINTWFRMVLDSNSPFHSQDAMNSRQVLQKLFEQRQRQRANSFIEVLQYLSAIIQIAF